MSQKILLGVCAATLALGVACSRGGAPTSPSVAVGGNVADATDGVTLKISAPTLVSPINNFQFQPNTSVVLTVGNVQGTYATFPVTYEVEIHDGTNAVVADLKFAASTAATTSTTVTSTLVAGAPMTWRARATYQGANGPWSNFAAFKTPVAAFRGGDSGSELFDPLTAGFSVGSIIGGHFVPGQGWEADSYNDGIDYDLKPCESCTLEFDVTNVGKGLGNPTDLSFLSMGDGSLFGGFDDFRNQPWKMQLVQRGDGDGTAMKLIWRIDGDDDDHNDVEPPSKTDGPDWDDSKVEHFLFKWTPDSFLIQIDGQTWFDGDLQGPYVPPNFRIELGCVPRGESQKGAIYRNVKVTKQ